ncbi:MAG: hypothetical protein KKC26_07100 [Nanoarchaeota archaeon]|nr:hypothetical protein [Nanoarchaeota archaeon]
MKDEKISENIRVEETGEKTETEKSNSKAILRQNKILRNLFITYMFVVGYQHLAFNFGWKYPAAYEIKNQHKGIIERKFMMNYFPKMK